jgi:FkbM family methyltransferase
LSIRTKFGGMRSVLYFDNWPLLMVLRVFGRKTGMVTYRKQGLEILVDHRGGGTRECITSDMYSRYIRCLELPENVNVLDLGANDGGFPLMLCLNQIKIAKVVCVEINPLTAQRLGVNLSLNVGSAGIAVNRAICDGVSHGSEIVMRASRGSTSESIFPDQTSKGSDSYSVPTITLSALYSEYFENALIDICKVDIEGAEYEVFRSAPDDLLLKFRYIFIELHEASKTPSFLKRVTTLGFRDITDNANCKTSADTEVRVFRGPSL